MISDFTKIGLGRKYKVDTTVFADHWGKHKWLAYSSLESMIKTHSDLKSYPLMKELEKTLTLIRESKQKHLTIQ